MYIVRHHSVTKGTTLCFGFLVLHPKEIIPINSKGGPHLKSINLHTKGGPTS